MSEYLDKKYEEGDDDLIVLEDEGKITFGISHIIAAFLATLIGSIAGFYLAHIY
ncbi:MAG: hypothetical protein HY097_02280 [Nitrospinae bacterium]|nr:hypothetical protein [Nitrospinota bacterium]MBI3814064.1 hypothetical protein [Nitrospinota bacterium]